MKKTIIDQVSNMTVAQMRKTATQHGIKNASKYKRVELSEMLVNVLLTEAKMVKAASKKSSKKETGVETIKRYKAAKVVADEIEDRANEIIANNITSDLFSVNRKILIVVMKKLGCEKWYRTYDKPTMIDKIKTAMVVA